MKYYMEQVIDKATNTQSVTEYTSHDEAERAYHHVLAQNIGGEDVDFVRCKVINSQGSPVMCEYWQKPSEVDPEEQIEPEAEKYYFTQVRTKTDDSTLRGMAPYDTLEEALVAFHNLLYGVMADAQYKGAMVLIEDKRGAELHRRYWERS